MLLRIVKFWQEHKPLNLETRHAHGNNIGALGHGHAQQYK